MHILPVYLFFNNSLKKVQVEAASDLDSKNQKGSFDFQIFELTVNTWYFRFVDHLKNRKSYKKRLCLRLLFT